MLGEEIIPANSYCLKELDLIERYSDFFVFTLNKEFLNLMDKYYPNTCLKNTHSSTLHYYLNTIGYHHLIFKGHIDYYWERKYTDWGESEHSEIIHYFIDYLTEKYSTLFVDDTHDTVLISKYAHAINFYEECIKTKISVGVFLEGDLLYKNRFMDWWIKYIELTTFAKADPFASNQLYDLVISNVDCSYLKKRGKYFFFLTNYNEKKDIFDLDQLLHEIYSSSR